ncbi:hypothetical protein BXY66_0547 [Shimia isoporae]|uniref:Uncharacterized protein n=1 Tax=Shimia isoporae TaxID=647720 RepID=A0A4V2Q3U0_9RHOB|nr:hypothetical protein [Shimia isoporae]TCL08510.1 hypothetical protein BXY66_0547 [Shimia isoporae]
MFVKASMIRDLIARAKERVEELADMLDAEFGRLQPEERAVLVPVEKDRRDPRFPRG